MKVTNFRPGGFPEATAGWSTGVTSINSNATTTDGGLSAVNFVQRITANGSNILLNPSVNIAAGSNIAITLDQGPFPAQAYPSNTLRIHSTGGSGTTLTVEEQDGSPTGTVDTLIFPNGSVTINGTDATVRDVPQAFIGARVFNSTTQNISSGGGLTAVTYDSEAFDSDGFHSTSVNTSRLTIPAGLGGKYLIGGSWAFAANANGERYYTLRVNGSTEIAEARILNNTAGPEATAQTISAIYDMAAGDYVEFTVFQNSGSTLASGTANRNRNFWIVKLDSGKVGQGIGARAYNTGTQSITTATWTALTLDSERFDTDGFHSTSVNTERFTVPAGLGGKYLLNTNIGFAANTTGQRGVRLRLNDATTIAQDLRETMTDGSLGTRMSIACVYDLIPGDYVETEVWQDSGGNLNSENSANICPEFSIMRLDSGSSGYSGASVFHSTTQNVSTATPTALVFDSENFDTDSYHSTSANTDRLTVPRAGMYMVGGWFAYDNNSTGQRQWYIRQNGGVVGGPTRHQAEAINQSDEVSVLRMCNAGDFFTLEAYQDSGGTRTIQSTDPVPTFWIHRVGN